MLNQCSKLTKNSARFPQVVQLAHSLSPAISRGSVDLLCSESELIRGSLDGQQENEVMLTFRVCAWRTGVDSLGMKLKA